LEHSEPKAFQTPESLSAANGARELARRRQKITRVAARN
jgi:hypothetical protein